jgi:protoheme IX farnesyltransferase
MIPPSPHPTRLLARLATAGSALTVGLIVLGGVVRITGSGMGCGDHWPRCNGEWFPPLDFATAIEISHRWVAALVSVAVLAVAAVALRRHRSLPGLVRPAVAAAVLLVAQVLLGAVTVKLELPPGVVIVHFANAMLLLACLVVTATRARAGARPRPASRHRYHRLVIATATLGFIVILFGAKVANLNAGWVCRGFPLCEGAGLLPPDVALGTLHWLHRILAFSFAALAIVLLTRLARGPLRTAAHAVAGLTVLQIVVAAAMVLLVLPPTLRAAHIFVGALLWVVLVAMVVVSGETGERERGRAGERESGSAPAESMPVPAGSMATDDSRSPALPLSRSPSLLADLVTLTKPRIISLLLVTTVAPMFITDRGIPPLSLVLWVILGGYLMAGGANAINMWFDRDIDTRMTRTRLRPIPSGRIAPGVGLAFGIGLAAIAFAVFYRLVNPLSAWLALGGLLFYVVIYTMWLKRSTAQNIVVGGAAGAFPPLVGWAAVTGSLDLAAIYLFAIIFYWTPPHFWALALMKQGEYARAGVPMMPVLHGERRTKVEMLLYTIFLLPLTVLPAFFGALGWFYLAAALILGARLLWYCVQLLRESGVTPTAWRMYRYSLLYLALLFVAMGVDRAIPYDRGPRPGELIILDRPDAPDMVAEDHSGH